MDWYDVEDIVFDSNNNNNFENLKCPDCGHELIVEKYDESAKITCKGCGIINIYDF